MYRYNKQILKIFSLLISCSFLANAQNSNATKGFDLQVDASSDGDGDTRWEDSVGASGYEFLLDDSPGVNRVSNSSSYSLFSHAYDFPGGSTGNEAGAQLITAGTTNTRSCLLYTSPSPRDV